MKSLLASSSDNFWPNSRIQSFHPTGLLSTWRYYPKDDEIPQKSKNLSNAKTPDASTSNETFIKFVKGAWPNEEHVAKGSSSSPAALDKIMTENPNGKVAMNTPLTDNDFLAAVNADPGAMWQYVQGLEARNSVLQQQLESLHQNVLSSAQTALAQMLTSIGRTVGATNETFGGFGRELVAAVSCNSEVRKRPATLKKYGGATNAEFGSEQDVSQKDTVANGLSNVQDSLDTTAVKPGLALFRIKPEVISIHITKASEKSSTADDSHQGLNIFPEGIAGVFKDEAELPKPYIIQESKNSYRSINNPSNVLQGLDEEIPKRTEIGQDVEPKDPRKRELSMSPVAGEDKEVEPSSSKSNEDLQLQMIRKIVNSGFAQITDSTQISVILSRLPSDLEGVCPEALTMGKCNRRGCNMLLPCARYNRNIAGKECHKTCKDAKVRFTCEIQAAGEYCRKEKAQTKGGGPNKHKDLAHEGTCTVDDWTFRIALARLRKAHKEGKFGVAGMEGDAM